MRYDEGERQTQMAKSVGSGDWTSEVLESEVPVLVDFWAEWCGPCKMIAPTIDELASEYEGRAKVVKLNVDTDGEVASQYGIMSIPALLVFKGGKVVDQMVGNAPKPQIKALIDRAL
jgi:thioredoxin 1